MSLRKLIPIILLLFIYSPVLAQNNVFTMQRADLSGDFRGTISDAATDEVLIYLEGLQAGDQIVVVASGLTGTVAPHLILTDARFERALAESPNAGGEAEIRLQGAIDTNGNYVVGMFSRGGGSGAYQVRVSVNDALPTDSTTTNNDLDGDFEAIIEQRGQIETFAGSFGDDDDEIVYALVDVQPGDTIYAYAAGAGQVDTYLYLMDATQGRVFAEDDDGGGGFNSALSYLVETPGTYTIGLITIGTAGNYELRLGVNTPDVISNATTANANPTDLGDFECSTARVEDRPILSGEVLRYEAPTFVIHYTNSGRDAASSAWIEELAEALQLSLDVQFNDLGWALPPEDCGEGGDARLDVYVMDMSDGDAIGYASPENVVGDNPFTDAPEYYAAYSYLAIENDMEFTSRQRALNLLRTTAAHEIHHNIQFGYDVNDRFMGFYEAGAAWIETLVYPTQTNVYEDAADVFATPDVCIGSLGGDGISDLRIYGEWVMIDSFARDLGLESYQFIWEYMAAGEGLNGFYRALDELGTTPQEVIVRMAVRNLLYDYVLAKNFIQTVDVEAAINGVGFVRPRSDGVQQLAVDYVRFNRMSNFTLEIAQGDDLMLYVVGIDGAQRTADLFVLGERGTVDLSPYTEAYAIILNTVQHDDTDVCEYTNWVLQVLENTGEGSLTPESEDWSATRYVTPD